MKHVAGGDPRLLEQYFAMLAGFAEHPPFPIHGLREPVLTPAFLAEFGREGEAWQSVQLVHGDRDAPDGPLVTVRTGPPGSAAQPEDVRAALLAALAAEAEAGPAAGKPSFTTLPDGGELCRLDGVWALRLTADGQRVTVVGRGLAPERVRIGVVPDLGPYVAEREALRERYAAGRRAQSEPVPVPGIAAVRALLESHLPGAPAAGEAQRALWRRAVAEQARAAGCDADRAEALLASLVGQLTRLRQDAPWFAADAGLRAAAFEETLRHGALGERVASRAAQQAWERYWTRRAALGDAAPELDQSRARWLAAWEAWRNGRISPR
ncbi:hypothetical protein ACIGXM_18290 [Kitasatospora sp. NPDC052896]|uniref:hypothetical protein n=1 Tax=Kitasatospora sp. NPDC052896 TaxID=3364061 RepID=UPI0037C671DE